MEYRTTLEHQAFVAVQRLASELGQDAAELLKAAGLSMAQYNVLRVLRGAQRANGETLSCGEVAARLMTKDPDITRLLDRLEARELVLRERSTEDRRVVTASITEEGIRILDELDEPMAELHIRQLGHLGAERLEELLELLHAASRTA